MSRSLELVCYSDVIWMLKTSIWTEEFEDVMRSLDLNVKIMCAEQMVKGKLDRRCLGIYYCLIVV